MIVLAGPNGAGKTTYYFNELEDLYPHLPFINVDFIQAREMKDPEVAASFVAAKMATERREQCLAARKSFIWESSFSHPSKTELIHRARDAGYHVRVIHVGLASVDISLRRVAQRVSEGGLPVDEELLRHRFERCNPHIREAVVDATEADVFDNSVDYEEPTQILGFQHGRCCIYTDPPPWVDEIYLSMPALSGDEA